MYINKLYDDVYEIKYFLTKKELIEVYKIIENTPEEAWFDKLMKKERFLILLDMP